jgi:hypothetical protein
MGITFNDCACLQQSTACRNQYSLLLCLKTLTPAQICIQLVRFCLKVSQFHTWLLCVFIQFMNLCVHALLWTDIERKSKHKFTLSRRNEWCFIYGRKKSTLLLEGSQAMPARPSNLNNIDSSVRTSKKTQHFSITKTNWFVLFKEIIAVYSDNHAKSINTNSELLVVKAGSTYC